MLIPFSAAATAELARPYSSSKAQPIASNADEAGRARNRRVEIHISPIVDDDVRGRY